MDIDYSSYEIELKAYYFKRVNEIIEHEFKGKDKEDIRDMFDTQIELDNITKIYRLKKYYNASPFEIKKVLNVQDLQFIEDILNINKDNFNGNI